MQDDNDEDDFESLDQDVDNDAEELLLQQKQHQANANQAEEEKPAEEQEPEEAASTTSWLGSRKYQPPKMIRFLNSLFNERLDEELHFIAYIYTIKYVNL